MQNDYYLVNVGYLRIKNLTLGYTLPVNLTSKLHTQKIRVYFTAENILTWRFGDLTKYIDPELAAGGINYSNPHDANSSSREQDYPLSKTYMVGISLTF